MSQSKHLLALVIRPGVEEEKGGSRQARPVSRGRPGCRLSPGVGKKRPAPAPRSSPPGTFLSPRLRPLRSLHRRPQGSALGPVVISVDLSVCRLSALSTLQHVSTPVSPRLTYSLRAGRLHPGVYKADRERGASQVGLLMFAPRGAQMFSVSSSNPVVTWSPPHIPLPLALHEQSTSGFFQVRSPPTSPPPPLPSLAWLAAAAVVGVSWLLHQGRSPCERISKVLENCNPDRDPPYPLFRKLQGLTPHHSQNKALLSGFPILL